MTEEEEEEVVEVDKFPKVSTPTPSSAHRCYLT